jgi:hypothetical protein
MSKLDDTTPPVSSSVVVLVLVVVVTVVVVPVIVVMVVVVTLVMVASMVVVFVVDGEAPPDPPAPCVWRGVFKPQISSGAAQMTLPSNVPETVWPPAVHVPKSIDGVMLCPSFGRLTSATFNL